MVYSNLMQRMHLYRCRMLRNKQLLPLDFSITHLHRHMLYIEAAMHQTAAAVWDNCAVNAPWQRVYNTTMM